MPTTYAIDTHSLTLVKLQFFYQQWKLLQMADNIDPKTQKQSIHDLNIDITETKTKDDYIIIMVDLNKKN